MLNIDDRLIKETLPKIKPNALAVLLAIAIHLNKDNTCFPSHDKLMKLTGLGSETVYNALKRLKKEGLLLSSQSIDSKHKTFSRRTFTVNTDLISIFVTAKNANPLEEKPLADLPHTAHPDAVEPHTANHETYPINQSISINKLEQLNNEGEENTPTPEPENLKEEEVKRGLVAPPAEAAEAAAPRCPACMIGIAHNRGTECDSIEYAATHTVTTIDPTEPHTRIVSPFVMPTRVETVDEAEEIIMQWATTDGRESVRKWYSDAARQCTAADVTAMVSKFAGVYLTIGDEGKRQRMAQDPLQFFKYTFKSFLKTEKSFGARAVPGASQQHAAPSALPASLQGKVGR